VHVSDFAIRTESLAKSYRLGSTLTRADTLRDQLAATAGRLRRRTAGPREKAEILWALEDVSLEVEVGEVIGLIGPNGAGKSTLLKILSRITEPTSGRALLRGRVGSLLEVGTGFHGELTGRENVFLSGAILGMPRAEIRRKFDEILAFAEVERFVDTPVKRYSSGMYVRLAFAVAAFLEPEILLIDEVLAVGDAKFQRKCIGMMGSVAREGKTVLIVSHNMGIVNQLCPRTIWLDGGHIRTIGDTPTVVRTYLQETDAGARGEEIVIADDPAKDSQVVAARLITEEGESAQRFSCDQPVVVELDYLVRRKMRDLYGCFEVDAEDGTSVLVSYSYDMEPNPLDELEEGLHTFRITIPARSLGAGDYRIHFSVARGMKSTVAIDSPGVIARFSLDDVTTLKGNRRLGYLSTLLDWEVEPSDRPSAKTH
jgi:lipopolysaccharide transport system ATP-binding protein